MHIDEYDPNDSHKLATLWRAYFKEFGWPEEQRDHLEEPHLLFHLPNDGILLVAKDKGEIIGTAGIIFRENHQGLLKRFYLTQNYRGTGLARTFLDMLMKQGVKRGVKTFLLDVDKVNTRAIKFYEKNGFIPTYIIPQADWPESNRPDTHIIMSKDMD